MVPASRSRPGRDLSGRSRPVRRRVTVLPVLTALLICAAPVHGEIFPADAFTDGASGATGAPFLKLPTSARYEALGETVSAGAEGIDAMFYNPAGLARLDPLGPADLSVGYMNFLDTINSGSVLYARPGHYGFLGFSVLGAGFIYQSQAAQTRYSAMGDNTGQFSPSDFALSVSLAKRTGGFLLGGNVKLVHSNVDTETGSAAAADLGVQRPSVMDLGNAPLDFGMSVVNFGSPMKMGGSSFPMPMIIRFGLLWHISEIVGFATDANFPVDSDPYSSLGAEAEFPLGVKRWKAFLRGGYNQRYSRGIEGLAGFSVGGGLDLGRIRVDYAWTPYGDLGMTNKINLGFRL